MSEKKMGAGSLQAMGRLGLQELRNAVYAQSNVAAATEKGMYGTALPSDVQEQRSAEPMPSAPATPSAPPEPSPGPSGGMEMLRAAPVEPGTPEPSSSSRGLDALRAPAPEPATPRPERQAPEIEREEP